MSNQTESELREEVASLREQLKTVEHMVVTCGVIATHPDPTLGDRAPYSTEWNSQQAERVRILRRMHDQMRDIGNRMAHSLEAARCHGFHGGAAILTEWASLWEHEEE